MFHVKPNLSPEYYDGAVPDRWWKKELFTGRAVLHLSSHGDKPILLAPPHHHPCFFGNQR
ncbi:hypothetical protein DPMN_093004, partial [Dreissena polymorpha]